MDPAFAERKKGRAAIHWASRNGCLEVLVWLIEEKGIDKDCEMSDGTTPFMRAAWMGHLELCEYLVKIANCDIHRENKYRCFGCRFMENGVTVDICRRDIKT
jgi:ankyrin repeat protein